MKRSNWRDLFIIHTKSIQLDQSVVDLLAKLLISAGYSIWGYDDWDWWEKRKEQSSWGNDLLRNGYLLDPNKAIEGDAPIKARQVDTGRLDEMISRSRAVLFLYPSTRGLTSGMKEELFSLRRDHRNFHREGPVPVAVWSTFENNAESPIKLDFGDGYGIVADWQAVFKLRLDGDCIFSESLIHICVWIAKLLIEQRLAYAAKTVAKRKIAEVPDPVYGYV